MRDLSDILADCRTAFSGLSESEKAAAAELLVGKNAMSGFLALMNAKKCADANPGYSVFDVNGVNIYTPKTTAPAASADVPFLVKVSISDLNIRKGPGTDYDRTGQFTGIGVFTIVEAKSGKGSTAGWGRLKSGVGWISLDYVIRI